MSVWSHLKHEWARFLVFGESPRTPKSQCFCLQTDMSLRMLGAYGCVHVIVIFEIYKYL